MPIKSRLRTTRLKATIETARDLLAYNPTQHDHAKVYKAKLDRKSSNVMTPNGCYRWQNCCSPCLALAHQRSTLETAIEENRTIINLVNDYVNNSNNRRKPDQALLPRLHV